jgi:hypothetical protein
MGSQKNSHSCVPINNQGNNLKISDDDHQFKTSWPDRILFYLKYRVPVP